MARAFDGLDYSDCSGPVLEGTMAEKELRAGRRVWVRDTRTAEGRSFGRIEAILTDILSGRSTGGFAVRLDEGNVVVTCDVSSRGSQWDFAD